MNAGYERFLWFIGRVENIDDPTQQGRVQVRCYQYHEDDPTKLPTLKLPWAIVMLPTTSAGIHGIGQSHGLLVGSDVWGFFADGDHCQVPVIMGVIGMTMYNNFTTTTGQPQGIPSFLNGIDPQTGQPLQPNSNVQANTSIKINDPTMIGNLNTKQSQALKSALAFAESSGDYTQVNSIGFCGRYQFGYEALQDCGMVNKMAHSNSSLTNPQVWTGKFGVTSRDSWLQNQNAQEQVMDYYMQLHYSQMIKAGCIAQDTPADVVGGYLAVAHLGGLGNAIKYKAGIEFHDAYGTSTSKYFAMGKSAVDSAGT